MLAGKTIELIRVALKSDPTVTPNDRKRLLALLQQGNETLKPDIPAPEPRIIRRAEAARRLGCSLRLVDRLSAQGLLTKHHFPGRVRSSGVPLEDLEALIFQHPEHLNFSAHAAGRPTKAHTPKE
jgi:hypothetical protein